MDYGLSPELLEGVEGMISRRIANTGETREQACAHIQRYLQKCLDIRNGIGTQN